MAVLYRKYRPQVFSEVLGQKAIIQTLKNQVRMGSLAHAYLFTGSRGVGKTSIARILAKAVNCQTSNELQVTSNKWDGDACGQCAICKAVEQGNFIDLIEIDAASNTSVENVRDLIEHVKFVPSIGKYKVFIIDEVHMLSKSAFNALLKTLEEPPKHVIFILATTEINKVPVTIISRTQKFDFKSLSQGDLLVHLQKLCNEEQVNIKNEVLELVAQNAEGSVRDSLSLLGKVLTLGDNVTLEECQQLLGVTDIGLCEQLFKIIANGQAEEVPKFIDLINERGLDYTIFNRDFLEYLRKALILSVTKSGNLFTISDERLLVLQNLSEKLSRNEIIFLIRLFLKSYKDIQNSPDPQVPLLIAGIEGALKKQGGQQISQIAGKPISNSVTQQEQVLVEKKVEPPILESVTNSPALTSEAMEMLSPVEENMVTTLTLEQVLEFWPKVIAKVKEVNGPLASLLKNSPVVAVEGGRIVLQTKFNFDKQSIESTKNTALIRTLVEKISGEKLGLLAKVVVKDNKEPISASEAVVEALKVFGGEVIE